MLERSVAALFLWLVILDAVKESTTHTSYPFGGDRYDEADIREYVTRTSRLDSRLFRYSFGADTLG